jgi:RNA polymerase sigma-70 factor, ECF subfamily
MMMGVCPEHSLEFLPVAKFSVRFDDLAMHSSGCSTDPADSENGLPQEQRVTRETDAALARQIQAGDQQAFAIFYDRFAPGLFSMVYAILHDQKEAEDVLQEAFVQMWKRMATYDSGRGSLFTWAVMISRHKAIDRLRVQQRKNRRAESTTLKTADSAAFVPLVGSENALPPDEQRERVCAALNKLEIAQREAIDLAFFAGLTQSQIAEKLGAPLGTVKARIRRGLLALREELKGVLP